MNHVLKDCIPIFLGFVFIPFDTMNSSAAESNAEDSPQRMLHSNDGIENPPDLEIIADSRWQDIERSVDRGIDWLVENQRPDGSYLCPRLERSAITALAAMAMISRGHVPGKGPAGLAIDRSIDFILKTQKSNGLLCDRPAELGNPSLGPNGIMYSHGICGLFLCEVYGMTSQRRSAKIQTAIESAMGFMRQRQLRRLPANREAEDRGGWRYLRPDMNDGCYSDLSITSWMVMFMRSAENAGFDVPYDWADQALRYVRRCYDPKSGGFHYILYQPTKVTRGMTGAGVLCLFLTGNREPAMETSAGKYIARYPFNAFNQGMNPNDRYFYSAYYCSQAAMQLGGETWAAIYPSLSDTLLQNQNRGGSWPVASRHPKLGQTYSSSMAILALTPPYQLLPIYQR